MSAASRKQKDDTEPPHDHPEFRHLPGDGPVGGSLIYPVIVALVVLAATVLFVLC